MKTQTTSQIINTIKVITLALLLALGISYVSATSHDTWTGPTATPPGNNVFAPLNVGPTTQTKAGILSSTRLTAPTICFGPFNSTNCRTAWPDSPLSQMMPYTAAHEYPISGQLDVYTRVSPPTYVSPYPILDIANVITKAGIDASNNLATNWFTLGYSYYQPWQIQNRTALYVEEGDNSSPNDLYTNTTGVQTNSADILAFCVYNNPGQVHVGPPLLEPQIQQQCDALRAAGHNVTYYIVNVNSTTNGTVTLQARLVAGTIGCNNTNYLSTMSMTSWGSHLITNLKITPYQTPNVPSSDNCNNQNVHSKIQGRLIITPRYTTLTDPMVNHSGTGKKFMIKSVGIALLKWIL